MLTLTLTTVAAVLKMVFAGIAAAIVLRCRQDGSMAMTAWRWALGAFLVSGLSGVFQAVWAVMAVRGGAGSDVWDSYMEWMPAMNYSRFTVMVGCGITLAALPFLPVRARDISLTIICLVSTVLLLPGIAAGMIEGAYVGERHAPNLAVWQVVETVALLAALFSAVVRQTMDSWLWLALCIYAIRQAANAIIWAASTTYGVEGAWHAPFWMSAAVGITMWSIMIGMAVKRLWLARQGIPAMTIFALEPHVDSR
ncbi:hypothetical protein BH23GEM8_BH23GEM8_01880 [soil metagenome]